MVGFQYFQEILNSLDTSLSLRLPKCKDNVLNIKFTENKSTETMYEGAKPPLPFGASDIFYASMDKWRRLTTLDSRCKSVYEITFDIEGNNFTFTPGDTVGILPQNSKSEVHFILNHLNVKDVSNAEYILSIESGIRGAKIPPHIPIKSTLNYVFTHCVDLRGVIKKLFLLMLSRYTKDESERKVLEYLCSTEGSSAYTTHILNRGICILDLFDIFQSCKPPISVLLEYLPRLLPRPYSIVNSQSSVIKICFSVMDIGNNRKGLTTSWLENKILENDIANLMDNLSLNNERQKIPIYLRKNINEFKPPQTIEIPLILIGPGTGVSPYIGFLEEREKLIKKEKKREQKREKVENVGFVWLFYGCRDPDLDYIYKEELNYFVSKGVLNKLSTAFSRHGDPDVRYVQDLLVQNGEEVIKLLMQGAHVYVCGDIRVMATQVKETLIQCLSKYTEKTANEAEKFISDMQKEKRYLTDVWN